MSRNIPVPVKRQLRQESFFGCAACGSPILEYHHIIPWAEDNHNDPEHMIALCPTHHRELGKMPRSKSYALKQNPHNQVHGFIKGCLGTEAHIDRFVVGSNTYINTPVIFSYFEQPIISYRIEDGQFLLSIYLPDRELWPSLRIVDNEMLVNRGHLWDFEFRTNYLKVHREDETFFEIDIRNDTARVAGTMLLGDVVVKFDDRSTNLDGGRIRDSIFESCGTGISLGDRGTKVHWPTYAMLIPQPYFERNIRR
ncbi:HNH endonuclease signature motif containing protein [Paracoccus aminophilus]|nr:HNH endonuclease [Paracoccus aminophilus]